MERFRLPWCFDASVDALTAAYMAEVEYRHRDFIPDEPTKQHIRQAAEWLPALPKSGSSYLSQIYGVTIPSPSYIPSM